MTEKQIYNRLNRCYENILIHDPLDEWYGDDDFYIWVFYRPSEDKTFKMVLDTQTKDIRIEWIKGDRRWFDTEEAEVVRTLRDGCY